MFITLSSDFIYVIAMLKTTPLVVTVGLSLTIPVAVAGDFLLGRTVTLMSLLGALLVLGSFVAVGLEDSKNEEALGEEVAAGEDQVGIQLRLSSEVEDRHPATTTSASNP
jgi:solute carrier family 35 protein F5